MPVLLVWLCHSFNAWVNASVLQAFVVSTQLQIFRRKGDASSCPSRLLSLTDSRMRPNSSFGIVARVVLERAASFSLARRSLTSLRAFSASYDTEACL